MNQTKTGCANCYYNFNGMCFYGAPCYGTQVIQINGEWIHVPFAPFDDTNFEEKDNGKSIERLNIADFCEQYVGHNTTVYLYTEKYKKNDEGMLEHYLYKLWCGMDWQINFSEYDEIYFETHPTVEKCPYREYKVVKVINAIDGFEDDVLQIALVVEKESDDENTIKGTEMNESEFPKESCQMGK